jgi:hypothetical protein
MLLTQVVTPVLFALLWLQHKLGHLHEHINKAKDLLSTLLGTVHMHLKEI